MNSESKAPGDDFPARLPRRDFIRMAGFGALGVVMSRRLAAASPEVPEVAGLVPRDKKLTREWLEALSERGEPAWLSGEKLKFVGLPVSGITTGQLYLGGDGRLWHWDIFNYFVYTDTEHYTHPPLPTSPLQQGFQLQLGERIIPFDRTGFSDVRFRGEYPIGTVKYQDSGVPLAVTLEAYSPFSPLSLDDSSLPATVMAFTLTNRTGAEMKATISGELENAVFRFLPTTSIRRFNQIISNEGCTFIECRGEELSGGRAQETMWQDWANPNGAGWSTGAKFTSPPFKITAPFLNFEIGGPPQPSLVEVKLLQEGRLVRLTRSAVNERRRKDGFDVADLVGQMAQFEVTALSGGQPPSAGVGPITWSDRPWRTDKLTELPDFGTVGLALLGDAAELQQERMAESSAGKLIGRPLRVRKRQFGSLALSHHWPATHRHCPERVLRKYVRGWSTPRWPQCRLGATRSLGRRYRRSSTPGSSVAPPETVPS